VARAANALGSIDANTGDELLGWDTDQFPANVYLTTQIMLEVLRMGGFTTGGLNFDAKVRRQSTDSTDLFYAHIGGMDAFARGLQVAHAILEDGRLEALIQERYDGWTGELGQAILGSGLTLEQCASHVSFTGEPELRSGRQELVENLFNDFVTGTSRYVSPRE
jgi:xylose isomerase